MTKSKQSLFTYSEDLLPPALPVVVRPDRLGRGRHGGGVGGGRRGDRRRRLRLQAVLRHFRDLPPRRRRRPLLLRGGRGGGRGHLRHRGGEVCTVEAAQEDWCDRKKVFNSQLPLALRLQMRASGGPCRGSRFWPLFHVGILRGSGSNEVSAHPPTPAVNQLITRLILFSSRKFVQAFVGWFGLVYSEVHFKSHGSFFTNSWIEGRLVQHSCLPSPCITETRSPGLTHLCDLEHLSAGR